MQVRHRPGRSLALWLCLTATLVLSGTLPLVATAASRAALAEILVRSPGLTVEQEVAGAEAFGAFRRAVDDQVRATMGDRLVPSVAYARLGPLALAGVNGRPRSARPEGLRLEAMGLAASAKGPGGAGARETMVSDGRLGMSASDAHRLGLRAGDDLCLAPLAGGTTWCARLTVLRRGPWGPDRPAQPTAGLTVPLTDLFRLAHLTPTGLVVAGLVYRLGPASLAETTPGRLAGRIDRLVTRLEAAGRRVASSPAAALARFEAGQRATAAWLRTLTGLVVLEGLVASLGVANRLLDDWRDRAVVLRARGWAWHQVWQVELATLGWVLAGAAAAALPLEAALSGGAGTLLRASPDGAPGPMAALAATLAGLAATLAAASGLAVLGLPAPPRRPGSRSSPGWRAHLLPVLLGLPGLAVLVPSLVRGPAATANPWPSLAPVAGVLLVGMATATVPPPPPSPGRHGPAALLARGQARSRPAQHAGATLVLTLAAAVVAFAAPAGAAAAAWSQAAARTAGVGVAIAALGAAIMAWTGLAIHFRRTGDRRRREYAGVAGHGLGEDQLRKSLTLERGWTCRCGLGSGSLLGLALAVSHRPLPGLPPGPVLGLAGLALCGLALGALSAARLADRNPVRIDPLTAGAIGNEA
jgi:hypothetical protein